MYTIDLHNYYYGYLRIVCFHLVVKRFEFLKALYKFPNNHYYYYPFQQQGSLELSPLYWSPDRKYEKILWCCKLPLLIQQRMINACLCFTLHLALLDLCVSGKCCIQYTQRHSCLALKK